MLSLSGKDTLPYVKRIPHRLPWLSIVSSVKVGIVPYHSWYSYSWMNRKKDLGTGEVISFCLRVSLDSEVYLCTLVVSVATSISINIFITLLSRVNTFMHGAVRYNGEGDRFYIITTFDIGGNP